MFSLDGSQKDFLKGVWLIEINFSRCKYHRFKNVISVIRLHFMSERDILYVQSHIQLKALDHLHLYGKNICSLAYKKHLYVIILCGKHNTDSFVSVVHNMFAHAVRQPSSQSLFSYCVF